MKERPISNATFRGMAYFGLSIRAHCVDCRHSEQLDLKALARRLGPDHGALHKDLVPLLRCRACGSKEGRDQDRGRWTEPQRGRPTRGLAGLMPSRHR